MALLTERRRIHVGARLRTAITAMVVVTAVVHGAVRLDAQTPQAPAGATSSDGRGIGFGFKAGVNFARLSNEQAGDSRIGLSAGALITRRITGPIGLQLEGLYSAKGDKVFDTTIAIDYLEIPLLVTVTPGEPGRLRPVFLTGPGVELKVRTRYGDVPDHAFQQGFREFVHGREFEWVFGAGLDVPYGRRHLTLEGRYTLGLTPVFDADPTDSDLKKRNRVFSVVAGYRLK